MKQQMRTLWLPNPNVNDGTSVEVVDGRMMSTQLFHDAAAAAAAAGAAAAANVFWHYYSHQGHCPSPSHAFTANLSLISPQDENTCLAGSREDMVGWEPRGESEEGLDADAKR